MGVFFENGSLFFENSSFIRKWTCFSKLWGLGFCKWEFFSKNGLRFLKIRVFVRKWVFFENAAFVFLKMAVYVFQIRGFILGNRYVFRKCGVCLF